MPKPGLKSRQRVGCAVSGLSVLPVSAVAGGALSLGEGPQKPKGPCSAEVMPGLHMHAHLSVRMQLKYRDADSVG